jgi:hypothetical protein
MPAETILLWLGTQFCGFIWGIYFLWKIEKSGVKRWGSCGSTLRLGYEVANQRLGKE